MIHIYRCENPKRTRRKCPHHKKLEYGELQEFYDTTRVFFDCGTWVDYGYGFFEPPETYKKIHLFWDSERQEYVVFSTYSWSFIGSSINHGKALKLAQARLKPNGIILDKEKEETK